MAVRIRKLAKELNRSIPEVIGVLHALGMSRYRSADDMLPSAAEERVRKGIRSGVQPVPVEVEDEAPTPPPRTVAPGGSADDVMARLVPGVMKVGEATPARPVEARRPEPTAAEPWRGEPARPAARPPVDAPAQTGFAADGDWRALQAERAAIESLRRRLESERAVVAAERAELEEDRRSYDAQLRALDGERESLARLGEALQAERQSLDGEREALIGHAERQRQRSGASVQELLEERGLRGSDEFERALTALAHARLLRDVLWTLRCDNPDQLRKLLGERLVLVDGVPAEAVGRAGPTVVVASERAEVPGASALARLLGQLSEAMLLNGMRRAVLVGGRPVWHRVLKEGLDPRLELRGVSARVRDGVQAATDVAGADLVILWGVELTPATRGVYTGSRAVVIELHEGGIGELIQTVVARLQE